VVRLKANGLKLSVPGRDQSCPQGVSTATRLRAWATKGKAGAVPGHGPARNGSLWPDHIKAGVLRIVPAIRGPLNDRMRWGLRDRPTKPGALVMSSIPLDLERRCEQRWAARFSAVRALQEQHRLERQRHQQLTAPDNSKRKTSRVDPADLRSVLTGRREPTGA